MLCEDQHMGDGVAGTCSYRVNNNTYCAPSDQTQLASMLSKLNFSNGNDFMNTDSNNNYENDDKYVFDSNQNRIERVNPIKLSKYFPRQAEFNPTNSHQCNQDEFSPIGFSTPHDGNTTSSNYHSGNEDNPQSDEPSSENCGYRVHISIGDVEENPSDDDLQCSESLSSDSTYYPNEKRTNSRKDVGSKRRRSTSFDTKLYFESPWKSIFPNSSDESVGDVSNSDSRSSSYCMYSNYPFETHDMDTDDLFHNYWLMQKNELDMHPPFCLIDQRNVTEDMREILVGWLTRLSRHYNHEYGTIHLAINILDRYTANQKGILKRNYQLVGMTCLLIAGKQLEIDGIPVANCLMLCRNLYERNQLLAQEKDILGNLQFNLHVPTAHNFLDLFFFAYCNVTQSIEKCDFYADFNYYRRLHLLARYLLERGLSSYVFMQSAHSICANAVLLLSWKLCYIHIDNCKSSLNTYSYEDQMLNRTSEHFNSFYNDLRNDEEMDENNNEVEDDCIDTNVTFPSDPIFNLTATVDFYFKQRLDNYNKELILSNTASDDVIYCINCLTDFIGKSKLSLFAKKSFKYFPKIDHK